MRKTNKPAANFLLKPLMLVISMLMASQTLAQEAAQTQIAANTDKTDDKKAPAANLGVLQVIMDRLLFQDKLGERLLTRQQLNEENAQNSHDLVRYNTEVDVAEVGRYGNQGFAMRGVDGNRVAISIDGIAVPEVETNEIFSPYGYMYEGRFNPDLESVGQVKITAGADSLLSGSGAVGGAVSYKSKEPAQLLRLGDKFGGYGKAAYSSKNSELLTAVGVAGDFERFSFIVNYSLRQGYETKNHANRPADDRRLDADYIFSEEEAPAKFTIKSLIYPNPMRYKRESLLTKLYYQPDDDHRFGMQLLNQQQDSLVNNELSNTSGGRISGRTNRAHDKDALKSYGINYRYQPADSVFVDKIEAAYNKSDIFGLADTHVYARNWNTAALKDLDYREYRPIRTKGDTFSVNLSTLSLDLAAVGTHKLSFQGRYGRQDYTQSAIYLAKEAKDSFVNYAFVDAKKSHFSLAASDSIRFGERLTALLGLRYDYHRYHPYFETNVQGFAGFDEKAAATAPCKNLGNNTLFCEHYKKGEELVPVSFDQLTYSTVLGYQVIPEKISAQYKIGTGFLAPTVSQVYSQFEGNGVRQVPNYNLRPETSLNQELQLQFTPVAGSLLSVGGYLSNYRDFIHTKYWRGNTNYCTDRLDCTQSVNLDKAQVYGIKVGGKVDLAPSLRMSGKLSASMDLHHSKDKAWVVTDAGEEKIINTLAAAPSSAIFGINYIAPDDSWQIHGKVSVIGQKKPEDTKTLAVRTKEAITKQYCKDSIYAGYCEYGDFNMRDEGGEYKISRTITGYEEYVDSYKHVDKSKTVVLYDLYGSKRFGSARNLVLNAGIYNITNVQYIPWSSLRQFNNISTNSMVDGQGLGFARYTAPGRNYALSLSYEF